MKRPAKKAKVEKMRAWPKMPPETLYTLVGESGYSVMDRPFETRKQALEFQKKIGASVMSIPTRIARLRVTEVRTPTRKAKA